MAMLTTDDLKGFFDSKRIEELASKYDASVGENIFDTSIVFGIIAQAEDLIKDTLCNLYTLAQIEASTTMKRLVAQISLYYLEYRRGTPSEATIRLYDEAMQSLNNYIAGLARINTVSELLPMHDTSNSAGEDANLLFNQSGMFDGIGDYPDGE
jgi:phage gp36-like protein